MKMTKKKEAENTETISTGAMKPKVIDESALTYLASTPSFPKGEDNLLADQPSKAHENDDNGQWIDSSSNTINNKINKRSLIQRESPKSPFPKTHSGWDNNPYSNPNNAEYEQHKFNVHKDLKVNM